MEIADFQITAQNLAGLIKRIDDGTISSRIAKEIFVEKVKTGVDAEAIISQRDLVQLTYTNELRAAIQKVLETNHQHVKQYFTGKSQLFDYFIGQVMALTKWESRSQSG